MKSQREIEEQAAQLRKAAEQYFDAAVNSSGKTATEYAQLNIACNTQADALDWVLERER